ncbi:mitotic spindle assembly checkpoint protein MAD1 [Episyrphus balteatus]|uniref:mitotic spindle assembly checkpoint protein MAD1 n=1 Tax=Episyrphus balteatus TaxID=286459 RepID=UPI0024868F10|nr:mitotic spindle assembly checkpoint protein MAD1 [Episyrphus balteatus]XP_055852318.1 mitotic spindle assembly checkpoint protein MAD1 [Episyrphus balteatus]
MEDIKTNFDKIMAQFNDSVAHVAPKKLTFDYTNDSLSETLPKKRKLSNSLNTSFNKSASNNDSANSIRIASADTSLNASLPPSPWESRRIRADLIEAKARIIKFKQEIERQHKIRQEMETMYDSKVRELTKQCDFSSNKLLDMEKHMTVMRKREQRSKSELTAAKSELNEQKLAYEETIHELQRTNAEIEENARLMQNDLTNELSDYRRHSDKLEMELELVSEELGNLKETLAEHKEKINSYDELQMELEKEKQASNEAKSRVKQLEYEISNYADWKEITKNTQARLASIPDLDKEIDRLKTNNKNLHDVLGDKLLLEEQVHDLKSRLEKYENSKNEAVALQVKLTSLEQEIKEWVKVAQDHCLPNTLVSPIALRSRIEQILQNDIILVSEKSTNQCEKNSIETRMRDLQQQVDMYTKNNESLKSALKHHKSILLRVQKKLMLVAKERDCYKQLLENFEKDLTISNAIEMTNPESQLRCRLDMLEKTLVAYKDMCGNLEKELFAQKSSLEMSSPSCLDSGLNDSYDHFKKEIENLRMENERLKRRKEELELELEHRCLKGDFNIGKYKVVHLSNNPATEAYENANNRLEKLQAEIERLKRRNQKLEEDKEDITGRLNETSNMTVNIKELNTLRAENESLNNKNKKMKDYYRSLNLEFREVCYMLFGYKIDRIMNNNNYKISSMYAETPDDYLNFRLNDSGILDMLETPYSISLKEMMQSQLAAHKSLPAFLSTLTLELFNKVTVAD